MLRDLIEDLHGLALLSLCFFYTSFHLAHIRLVLIPLENTRYAKWFHCLSVSTGNTEPEWTLFLFQFKFAVCTDVYYKKCILLMNMTGAIRCLRKHCVFFVVAVNMFDDFSCNKWSKLKLSVCICVCLCVHVLLWLCSLSLKHWEDILASSSTGFQVFSLVLRFLLSWTFDMLWRFYSNLQSNVGFKLFANHAFCFYLYYCFT